MARYLMDWIGRWQAGVSQAIEQSRGEFANRSLADVLWSGSEN